MFRPGFLRFALGLLAATPLVAVDWRPYSGNWVANDQSKHLVIREDGIADLALIREFNIPTIGLPRFVQSGVVMISEGCPVWEFDAQMMRGRLVENLLFVTPVNRQTGQLESGFWIFHRADLRKDAEVLRRSREAGLTWMKLRAIAASDAAERAAKKAEAERVVDMNQAEQPPQPLSQPPPDYPAELRGTHASGEVQVQFMVTTIGAVLSPKVLKSFDPRFDAAAMQAVRRWKYRPGFKHGLPVLVWVRALVKFSE